MTLLSPSNAGRWVNCPASPRMESQCPRRVSEDANEGIAAHWLAAQVLGGHVETINELTDRQAPNGVIITGEMVEHTQFYIDEVNTITMTPVVEQPLPILNGISDGIPDARCVKGNHIYIWDFKYGHRPVEARDNWQLACYMVGMILKHPEATSVSAKIVQPRIFHHEGRVRSWVLNNEGVHELKHDLGSAVYETRRPEASLKTGAHCNYCRALHACEAASRAAMNSVDVTMEAASDDASPVRMASELRTLRRAREAITLRLDAMEQHTIAAIDSGVIVPGFELDRAYGRRKFINDDMTVLEALTGKTLTVRKPMTPAQAERLGVDKKLVSQFTIKPETGRKLIARDNGAKAREVFK